MAPQATPTVTFSLPGAVPEDQKLLWAADGTDAPSTSGVCQRCGHRTQTVQLINRSSTDAMAFRFVAVRLAHLYGVMPRQGWIAPNSSARIELCLHVPHQNPQRKAHAGRHGCGNETDEACHGKDEEKEEALDPWRYGAGVALSQAEAAQGAPVQPRVPDIFGLETTWKECDHALNDATWAMENHTHEDVETFWQAIDTAEEKREVRSSKTRTAVLKSPLFQCELLSEVVAAGSLKLPMGVSSTDGWSNVQQSEL
jgi:hypothetical protein